MGDYKTDEKSTILVTGFMPFGNHVVNASWAAVQELEKLGLGDENNLVIAEIPVEYSAVKKIVPDLWKIHRPKLVVHVGVSGIAKELTLEQQAFNEGYYRADTSGECPEGHCCVLPNNAPKCIMTRIDMQKVCEAVHTSHCGVETILSNDAGRYLCDFIYYTSLHINPSCTAFIHVPPLGKPYSASELAHALKVAITAMVEQLG